MTSNWPKTFVQASGLWPENSAACIACAAEPAGASAEMFIWQDVQGPLAVQQRELQAETHQRSELHLQTLARLEITQDQENECEAGKFMCASVTTDNPPIVSCYVCEVVQRV